MKFFRKAAAYSELGKSLSALILQLEQTRRKINLSLDAPHELKFEISMWAYLYRKEVLDIIEEYGWPPSNPIIVPALSPGRLTLAYACKSVKSSLDELAISMDFMNYVDEILSKGSAFQEVRETMNNLNL